MSTLFERCKKVMPPVSNRATTLGVVSGEGSYLITDDGRRILDFASGVAVCNIGHNHPNVVNAATEQIHKLIHGGHNVVYYESYVRFAERLVEATGGNTMVYFSNSGAEANDGAMKLAKYVTKRPAIISFLGAFHGRTIGSSSITSSNSAYRKEYEGFMPSVYFLEYPNTYRTPYPIPKDSDCPKEYFQQFDRLFSQLIDPYSVAGIIMEPIQGEGGYIVPPYSFMKYVREICTKYGIMLIFDEIQTGFGRTGKLFAQEHFDVKPDIFTAAKGIASGFPLSVICAKKEIMEQWPAGSHGGTFGGNPVACAAGLATLDVLQNGAIENAKIMGEYFKLQLLGLKNKYHQIGDVRGLGLMLAIELVKEDKVPAPDLAAIIQKEALNKNLLILSCGTYHNIIRFIAPTIVATEQIDTAIEILDSILKQETH